LAFLKPIDLESAVEAMKTVPWTILQEMKGDTRVLKKIDDPEALLKIPSEGPYVHLNPSATVSVIFGRLRPNSRVIRGHLGGRRSPAACNTIPARRHFRTAAVLVLTRRSSTFASSTCKAKASEWHPPLQDSHANHSRRYM